MVIDSSGTDHRRPPDRRGQLLLVGAVVLAIVIVALSLVVNTVLYTQNADSAGISADIGSVDEFAFEVGKASRSILLRINHAGYERTVTELQENITQSIRNYSDALARSYAASGTVYVDVSDWRPITNGTRLIQPKDRRFTSRSGDGNWTVISSSEATDLGWFLLNVDLRNVSARHAQINVSGASAYLEYSMNRSEGGDGNNLTVAVSNATTHLETVNCTATGGRVLVDLFDGTGSFGQCSFTGIDDTLEPPYNVSITNGTRLNGTYSIVTATNWSSNPWGSGSNFPTCQNTPTPETCSTPIVWNGSITLTYESSTVQYAQQRNITVYGGDT